MDVVITLSEEQWRDWLAKRDLPEAEWSDRESYFWFGDELPRYVPVRYLPIRVPISYVFPDADLRVYVVVDGELRGYAPLYCLDEGDRGYAFVCRGGAVSVTTDEEIPVFVGWRYRWWKRGDETPLPDWRTP
jgi:hypothetical protein